MKNKSWRASKKRKQLSQTDREHLKRSGCYIPPVKQKKALQPLHWIEGRLESVLDWLKGLAFLEILQLSGNLSILFAAVVFVAYERQQRDAEVYQAWQVITAAYEQPGSGGRIQALEFLNSEPRRNPWFWWKWERESLDGLAAPNAYLSRIKLPEADLSRANLQGADLFEANLQEADLIEANLQEADLFRANLQEADLFRANLQKADLIEANLQKAYLREANLQKADLIGANLQKAYLIEAKLQKAVLSGANLQEADLSGANLQEADLSGANLQKAELRGAKLQGAKYTNRNTKANRCNAFLLDRPCPTKFPNGFNPQEAGMVLLKE